MTAVALVEALNNLCKEAVEGMLLPVSLQSGDKEQITREPEGYRMRLPQSSSAKKLAPYYIVKLAKSNQFHIPGEPKPKHTADVRIIGCVYCDDESLGSMMLLNLLERIKIHIMKQTKVGRTFVLDPNEPFEMIPYDEDTAPYFAGELIGTFQLPPIQQEVDFNFEEKGSYRRGSD